MKLATFAGAASFAHLLGLASAKAEDEEKKDDAASKAEEGDEDDKQREDESDEDYAKRMQAKEDAKKAEDVDPDDEDDDEEGEPKSKKAKKAEDEDAEEDDEDDRDEKAAKAERARCARIIAHGIANNCVRQAGVFAFDTDMTAAQAIKALKASAIETPAPSRTTGLRERMSSVVLPVVGTDGGPSAPQDPNNPKVIAAAIIQAGKKRRGEA